MLFFFGNSYIFLGQILLLGLLIYYTAPSFLFKKKYIAFVSISLVIIYLFSFLSDIIIIDVLRRPKPPPINKDIIHQQPPPRILVHFTFLLLAYVFGTVIEFVVFTIKKDDEIVTTKNENLQTELKFLKSQINPHFLFNSLNNIYAMSAIDVPKTQQSISYLSDMLRYVLYECESPYVPITKEVTYIEDYIKLFSLKSSKKYPIETNFNITNETIEIAPMLLIPFVENAFKHSNIEKIKDSFIRITITNSEDKITFKMENTVPSKYNTKDNVGGIGIANVKKRLSILYPKRHHLKIEENDGIFKVKLNLKNNV